jgi:hypothetical protein
MSRNPNICASCSSMADGMEESNLPETAAIASEEKVTVGAETTFSPTEIGDKVEELVGQGRR